MTYATTKSRSGEVVKTFPAATDDPVSRRISTGMVLVNRSKLVRTDPPIGGLRRSGYRRKLLGLGIQEFVNHKLIGVVDTGAPF